MTRIGRPFVASYSVYWRRCHRVGAGGTASESSNVEILRSHLHELQGRLGDATVLANARRQMESPVGSAAEQRTAMNIVAAQADASTFDALLARARQNSDPLAKAHLFEALAGVSDPRWRAA